MLKQVDDFLNRTTMYRLVLYYLLAIFVVAVILSLFGLLSFTPIMLALSAIVILTVSLLTNTIFSHVFRAPTNVESVYITALILILIITPPSPSDYHSYLPLALWAAVWATASKYILSIRKKHVFNPAALAVVLTAFAINQSATWWVGGNQWIALTTILGGLLVVRKVRKTDMVVSFIVVLCITIVGFTLSTGGNAVSVLQKAFVHAPIFFFAFVMLTEPLTTPPSRISRILYGALVGFLFAPMVHVGLVYSTPELALVIGNIFSYLVSPKQKLLLRLKEKVIVADGVNNFVFTSDESFNFRPGQYLEWTLSHEKPDNRGNRRYFTVASSPTEPEIHLGAKFYPSQSSFKKALVAMDIGDEIVASQLAGEFVLPKNQNEKLVFIAGGIGITPFRSMVKYLIDKNEKRDIVLFYSNKNKSEIAYRNIFDEASRSLGIKTVYTLAGGGTDPDWKGERGFIDSEMISKNVPDYRERMFYISGPHGMVTTFENMLKNMGVKGSQIKTDFFPGLV